MLGKVHFILQSELHLQTNERRERLVGC